MVLGRHDGDDAAPTATPHNPELSLEQPSSQAAQQVNGVSYCKLPSFWRTSPELWFFQVESQFQVHQVTRYSARYHLTVSSLDHDTISEVADIIRAPPELDKYKSLKPAIISRFTDSPDAQLHKLLTGVELGDRRPSQLLRHMRSLAGTRVSDDVLRVRWLDLLPQQTRRLLLLIRNQTLEELTAVADEAHDMGPAVMATSMDPATRSSGPASPRSSSDQIAIQLATLRLAITQLTSLTRKALQQTSNTLCSVGAPRYETATKGHALLLQAQTHARDIAGTIPSMQL